VDIRGDGGYIVAPPSSRASGSSYQWIESLWDIPLAEAPQELLDQITPGKAKKLEATASPKCALVRAVSRRSTGLSGRCAVSVCVRLGEPPLRRRGISGEDLRGEYAKQSPLEHFQVEKTVAGAQ
jgi:hypothetical protein